MREPSEGYTPAPPPPPQHEYYGSRYEQPYEQPIYEQPRYEQPYEQPVYDAYGFGQEPVYGFAPPHPPPFDPYANQHYLPPPQQSYYQPPEPFYAPSPPPPSTDRGTTFFDAPPHAPSPSPSDLHNGGGYVTYAFDPYQARATPPPPPLEPRKTGLSSAGMVRPFRSSIHA